MSSIAWAEPTTEVTGIEKGELEWERAIDDLGFKVRVLSKNLVGLSGGVTVNIEFEDGWIEEHVDPEEVYKTGNESETAAKYDNPAHLRYAHVRAHPCGHLCRYLDQFEVARMSNNQPNSPELGQQRTPESFEMSASTSANPTLVTYIFPSEWLQH